MDLVPAPHFHVVLCLDVRTLVCILALPLPLLGTFPFYFRSTNQPGASLTPFC